MLDGQLETFFLCVLTYMVSTGKKKAVVMWKTTSLSIYHIKMSIHIFKTKREKKDLFHI